MKRTVRVMMLLALIAAMGAGTALALQLDMGPIEITGTVIQVYSGNSFALFDGERTSVVVLDGIMTPERGHEDFYESANFLHQMLYQKMVRVQVTRKARFITYGVVTEAEENIEVNAQVLAQPFAEKEMAVTRGGAVSLLTLRGNEFHSSTTGFSITKPSEWVFLSVEDVQSSGEVIRLDDRALELAVKGRETVPLVAIARYPEPYENINPSATIHVQSVGGLLGKGPVELLRSTVPALERAFDEFTIIEGIGPALVSGRESAYMKATYTSIDMEGKNYQTVTRIYLVPRGTVMFLMSFSSLAADEAAVGESFDNMIGSIRIEK